MTFHFARPFVLVALASPLAPAFSNSGNAEASALEPATVAHQSTPPAAPTDPGVQAKRIAELESQLQKLLAELAASNARLAELEKALRAEEAKAKSLTEALNRGLPAGGMTVAPANLPQDVMAEDALRSITHFVQFARGAYMQEFAKPEPGTPEAKDPAKSSDTIPPRSLERWAAMMSRDWRKAVTWLVRPLRVESRGDGLFVKAIVVDEASGESIGREFSFTLDERIGRRYQERYAKVAPPDRFVVTGVFAPRFVANLERVEEGPFDSPPFVGPGIEVFTDLTVSGFSPVRETQPGKTDPSKQPTPAKAPASHP